MVTEIVKLLWEKPRRIKKVRRALRRGLFDGTYRDPRKWFNTQYKMMYRVPWKHCRDHTLKKMSLKLHESNAFQDGLEHDTRLAHKLVIFGAGSTGKAVILSSRKDTFDERCADRHTRLGSPLENLAQKETIDFSVDGCWTLLPPVPEGQPRAKHFYESVMFNATLERFDIPEKFAIRASWPLESNWDYAAAHVKGGKDIGILKDILHPDDKDRILARMLAGEAPEPDPEGSGGEEDGHSDEEDEDDLEDGEAAGVHEAVGAAVTPKKAAAPSAEPPESGAKVKAAAPKRARPAIPGAQVAAT